MISVIIPVFNRKDMVVEAVQSALEQQNLLESFEIIVVDDGSDKVDVGAALTPFRDRLRIVRQEHCGVSAARNTGIRLSKGEFIAFLDSDDLWLPDKLAAQIDFFSSHPDLLLCQTEELWMRNGKHLNPKKYHEKPEGNCFPLLLERCLISPSAVMMHRGLFETIGYFDENLPACEDYDLWLRIGCRYPVGLVRKPLVIKRGGHPDQLSATTPTLDLYRIFSIVNLLRSGSLEEVQRSAAIKILCRKAAIYVAGCRKRGNETAAKRIESLVAQARLSADKKNH